MEQEKVERGIKAIKDYYANPDVLKAYEQAIGRHCQGLEESRRDDQTARLASRIDADVMAHLPAEVRQQLSAIRGLNFAEMSPAQARQVVGELVPAMAPVTKSMDRCKGREL